MNSNYSRHYLYFVCIAAALGGLMFGFDVGIVSGAVPFIQSYFKINELQLGWAVSSLLLGCIIGSIASGVLSDNYGRKKVLISVALFFAASSLGAGLATEVWQFVSWRILGGLAVGATSVLSPMYIAEIAPSNIRGRLVAGYQLAITLGIFLAYSINYSLHDIDQNWRWMFASGAFPSLIFFILLFLVPESPRFLFKKGRTESAFEILKKLGGERNAFIEIEQIKESLTNASGKVRFKQLFSSGTRRAVLVGFLLAVFVQITGINTVIDYAPKILLKVGFEIKNALLQNTLLGLLNFVCTFIAIWLIDKAGRKRLYLIGTIGMALTLVLISLSFMQQMNGTITLICIMGFILFFASFIGPVFWTLVAEIFPNAIRGTAVAFASFTQWIFNFLVILLFPHIFQSIGGAFTFGFLAAMCILQLVITWFLVPETKGKTLEEIEKAWKEK
jgi:SP family arabinose:H+ symporter-like MFS transporter